LEDWRAVIGGKGEVGILTERAKKERWDTFVKKNETIKVDWLRPGISVIIKGVIFEGAK
jgi:hypothetical protein